MINRVYFSPGLQVVQGKTHTWFYSPGNHRWIRVEHYFSPIIEQILQDDGNIIFDNIRNSFEKKSRDSITPPELEQVIEGLLPSGVFFESRELWNQSVEDFQNREIDPDRVDIRMVYLHMTVRCNYRCWYCYNEKLEKSAQDELTTRQWLDIIDRLNTEPLKAGNLVFTGGEPLLRDDLETILEKARDYGAYISLLTNGSLLTQERLHRIVPLVNHITLSLDSFDREIQEKNRSGRGFENIIRLLEYFPNGKHGDTGLSVRSVITRENIDSVKQFRDTLREKYKIDRHLVVKFIPTSLDDLHLVPQGDEPAEDEIVEATPLPSDYQISPNFKRRCGACTHSIALDARGNIFPCQSMLSNPGYRMGNILDENWLETYKTSKPREIFNRLSVDDMDVCRDCGHRYFCGGGCPAISEKLYGNIHHRVDYQCEHLKKQARLFLMTSKMETVNAG